jgi:hypothetical protein
MIEVMSDVFIICLSLRKFYYAALLDGRGGATTFRPLYFSFYERLVLQITAFFWLGALLVVQLLRT